MRLAIHARALGLMLGVVLAAGTALGRAETIAVVGGKAYTMIGSDPIENATIVIRDGRIAVVDSAMEPPPGARVIHAEGRIVTPGLMNAGTQLGLIEVSDAPDTNDVALSSGPLGAAFDVQYAVNANSILLPLARADGLTRAGVFPSGAAIAPFAGTGATLRLVEGPDVLDTAQAMTFVQMGGMAAGKSGGSRSAQWILLKNALEEASRYRGLSRNGLPRDQLLNHLDAQALQPVIAGTRPLAIAASRESDIREAVRLSDTYHIHVVVFGGAEAWRVADVLASHKIPVVLDPFDDLPWTFDEVGARSDNAAILQRAGVVIAFTLPDIHLSHNAGLDLREAAGLAVANGLPWLEALKALTTSPAAIWKIDNHYGTLAPGQDADLVVWDGDPLEPASAPQWVFVQGRPASMQTRQQLLRERYSPARQNEPWPADYR